MAGPSTPPKKCRYCRAPFAPRKTGGKTQKFCSAGHRKAFHKYGAISLQKLSARIQRHIRISIAGEIEKEVESRLLPFCSEDRMRAICEPLIERRIREAIRRAVLETRQELLGMGSVVTG